MTINDCQSKELVLSPKIEKYVLSNTQTHQTRYDCGEHDHIASDLFNIHVVTEFSRDVIILTYNGCVLKLNR